MLTKVLAQALMPLNFALEAALLAVLLRRLGWRRTSNGLFAAGLAVLWLASTPVLAEALVASLERAHPACVVATAPKADAIVVLGGALGPALPPRVEPDLSDGADRVWLAARLYRAGKAPLVIATGGAGPGSKSERPESDAMRDLLAQWGVPPAAVLAEGASLDTHDNAVETRRLLDARALKRVLLVTSALHMPRALAAFREAGIDAVPCPTDFRAVDPESRSILDFLPDSEALSASTAALHEILGHLWYRLRGWA